MTHTPQHSQRHEIEFYSEPDGNTFLAGVAEVLRGPGVSWSQANISFRCVAISPDRRTYVIEEINIWQSLLDKNPKQYRYTKVVQVTLTCRTCSTAHKAWRIVYDDWRQDRYWLYTDHCPACPPMSTDVWLAQLDYYSERPTLEPLDSAPPSQQPAATIDVDMTDFD